MNGLSRLVCITAECALAAFGFSQVTYALQDLGTLGGTGSIPFAMNGSGQVVGMSLLTGNPTDEQGLINHAFLYSDGVMTDVGTLGGARSCAMAINSSGQVVGSAATSGSPFQWHAFLFSAGVMSDIGIMGDGSQAQGINDLGQVVGYFYFDPDIPLHGFTYTNGVMTDLGNLGWPGCEGQAVNSFGLIVGNACDSVGYEHAFLYSDGVMTNIGAAGELTSEATAVNDLGQVVGSMPVANGSPHAFLYSGGVRFDLGAFPGARVSHALALNNLGQVVGWGLNSAVVEHAFLYSNGTLLDLNDSLDSSGTGWVIKSACGINDSGQIVAQGIAADGNERAVLLTPNAGGSGNVGLSDFPGDATKVPIALEVRTPGTLTVLQRRTIFVKPGGTFSFPSVLQGTFDVSIKASHWLRKTLHNVTFPGTGYVTGLTFSLINGDVNGDNNINLADLNAVSRAWRATPGSPNWNPYADLNSDGTVNLADWNIVSKNWRKIGDQ